METQDPDDFLCLLFLASHPGVQLKAVTINPGSPEQVGLVRWALDTLGLINVSVGARTIGHAKRGSVSPWHARAFFDGHSIPPSTDAEEAWRVLVRECDESTLLFTGGALSNVGDAIANAGERFVAGCWVAQGGFAGDNVVPPEDQLEKFLGKTHCPTFNFNSNLPAARAALAHRGFGAIRLVSKNVCHSETNAFLPEHLERLHGSLRSRGVPDELLHSPREVMMRSQPSHGGEVAARHCTGLSLIAIGMREYLRRRPSGKLLHDPLAAASLLDDRVISAWAPVALETIKSNHWGCRVNEGSRTLISTRHDPERFWCLFLGESEEPK